MGSIAAMKQRHYSKDRYFQGDTVAHCGDSLQGAFTNTLTLTDIHTSWTENRATWCKSSVAIIEALRNATNMNITSRDAAGVRFSDPYLLDGAPTAIDAAAARCALRGAGKIQ